MGAAATDGSHITTQATDRAHGANGSDTDGSDTDGQRADTNGQRATDTGVETEDLQAVTALTEQAGEATIADTRNAQDSILALAQQGRTASS